MKKVIFACLMLCGSLGSFAHENATQLVLTDGNFLTECVSSTNPTAVEDDFLNFRLWFKRTKVYGAGGTECPPGQGICSITTEGGGSGGAMTSGSGGAPTEPGDYVGLDNEGNFCLIVVDAQGDRALAGNLFVQSAPYTIDRQLAADMKIRPYTIPAGQYKIQHEGKTAIVIFTVQKK